MKFHYAQSLCHLPASLKRCKQRYWRFNLVEHSGVVIISGRRGVEVMRRRDQGSLSSPLLALLV